MPLPVVRGQHHCTPRSHTHLHRQRVVPLRVSVGVALLQLLRMSPLAQRPLLASSLRPVRPGLALHLLLHRLQPPVQAFRLGRKQQLQQRPVFMPPGRTPPPLLPLRSVCAPTALIAPIGQTLSCVNYGLSSVMRVTSWTLMGTMRTKTSCRTRGSRRVTVLPRPGPSATRRSLGLG